jgi:D-glycero-alpha-D-manno-heptose-7-phosphate kinase
MIISKTPLRLSLAGGGTDLPSFYKFSKKPGKVISFAINRYIYISVNKKFDDLIRVSYSETEIVNDISKLKHNIIRECLKLLKITKGIEIVYSADLPLKDGGSGLGSSSALAVGVLNALHAFKGEYICPQELAEKAFLIEKNILGYPVGKQDHYPPAFGNLNSYTFMPNERVLIEPLTIDDKGFKQLNESFILFYTGINRVSSNILSSQQKNTKNKMEENYALLKLVEETKNILYAGKIYKIADILNSSWEIKKRLSENISNNKINALCKQVLNAGATGLKIAGAGGGGFIFAYCPSRKQKTILKTLKSFNYQKISIDSFGSRIIHASN